MKISEETLKELGSIITGDQKKSFPYRSGPVLVKFFNQFGTEDTYDQGFPSRGLYAEEKLRQFNDTPTMNKIILAAFDFRYFLRHDVDLQAFESIIERFNQFLEFDNYLLEFADKRLKIVNINNGIDEITVNAHFEDCQNKIIEKIEAAKFIIWVAVAWFTDPILFDLLLKKKQEGVNIQIIINDDQINQNSGLDYHKFECYQIPKRGKYENIMHNKFCVIDLKTVLHGSYNWTKKAQYNDETVLELDGRDNAEKFAEEFIQLKINYLNNQ